MLNAQGSSRSNSYGDAEICEHLAGGDELARAAVDHHQLGPRGRLRTSRIIE
jgi:hypothetical protein